MRLSVRKVLILLLLLGCRDAGEDALQGVVELEERRLGFEVGGEVAALAVVEGDRVEAGAALARLRADTAEVERRLRAHQVEAQRAEVALLRAGPRAEDVRAAAARVAAARAEAEGLARLLSRQEPLVAAGALADEDARQTEDRLRASRGQVRALAAQLEALRRGTRAEEIAAAEARLAAAEASLALADEQLARRQLEAGAPGVVLAVHAEVGEVVAPGQPIVTLADTARPFVDVFVPQAELAGIEVGLPAAIRVDALDAPLAGRVELVGRTTEFTPSYLFSDEERELLVVRVRVRVDDPEERLPAGVPAFVTLDRPQAAP